MHTAEHRLGGSGFNLDTLYSRRHRTQTYLSTSPRLRWSFHFTSNIIILCHTTLESKRLYSLPPHDIIFPSAAWDISVRDFLKVS
jgi:hypothetical protein